MAGLGLIHVSWDASEAEAGEILELVVRFQDVTYLSDSFRILVVVREAVKGSWVIDLTIAGREVDGDRK